MDALTIGGHPATMIAMVRVLVGLAMLSSLIPRAAGGQAASVLHIKIVLSDAERKVTPLPRHALLISDNPTSAPPRRIVTALDGTADVRLPPGNYTVESDRPVTFAGKIYQWTQMVDIVAGRDAVLELTSDNADVDPVSSATTPGDPPAKVDGSSLLIQWQDSVVAVWTPTTHASGFVVGANGLIATNQRVIGTATSVEVQLTATVKVAGKTLVTDSAHDVAVLWIDPAAVASLRPLPLGCAEQAKPSITIGQEIVAIEIPLRQRKGTTSGVARSVEEHAIVSDLALATGSTGGPVFTADGAVVGITSIADESVDKKHGTSRVVRIGDACDAVASAEKKMKDAAPPNGTRLPVESVRPLPVDALKNAAQRRVGSLSPYQMSSSNFDIAFITPLLTYGAQYQSDQMSRRGRSTGGRLREVDPVLVQPLMDFSNWFEYVADIPAVLLVRATPKMVDGFWTKVARGAAQTRGIALPPIKHFRSGFSRMRAFCGDTEITPIHPFKLEQRVSENDAIYEGLYVFDPGALEPACGSVKLGLYSEKEPEKAETLVVDPRVIQQIWEDFAPYRDVR
jgi:S1-C subfamily serine protease